MFTSKAILRARPLLLNASRVATPTRVLSRAFSLLPSKRSDMSADKPAAFVKSQKLGRPMSPHLTIYDMTQLTALMSFANRATGGGLALGFYIGMAAYAIVPFSSATFVAALYTLPLPFIYLLKAAMAFPFAYHSINGIRHLFWDSGSLLTMKGVYTSGKITMALTAITGIIMVIAK